MITKSKYIMPSLAALSLVISSQLGFFELMLTKKLFAALKDEQLMKKIFLDSSIQQAELVEQKYFHSFIFPLLSTVP